MVVAVSGDVWPNGRVPVFFGAAATPSATPYPPYRWATFLVDARSGGLIAVGDAGIETSFDRLPSLPSARLELGVQGDASRRRAARVIPDIGETTVARGRALDPKATALADEAVALGTEGLGRWLESLSLSQIVVRDIGRSGLSALRWAWTMAFAGYTAPAIAVARGIDERALLGMYMLDHPDRAVDWIRPGPAKLRRKDVVRLLMADLVPPEGDTADEMFAHSVLRKFAADAAQAIKQSNAASDRCAHQGSVSLGTQLRLDEPRGVLRLGGRRDRHALRHAGVYLVMSGQVLMGVMPDAAMTEPLWSERLVRHIEAGRSWVEKAGVAVAQPKQG